MHRHYIIIVQFTSGMGGQANTPPAQDANQFTANGLTKFCWNDVTPSWLAQ